MLSLAADAQLSLSPLPPHVSPVSPAMSSYPWSASPGPQLTKLLLIGSQFQQPKITPAKG